MIEDRIRTGGYAQAIARAVRPGSIAVDLGAGTGLFSMLACRSGARRVYAIESDDVIQLARELAAVNGFSDRIEFIQGISTQLSLPEKCDVIISDIRGILPLFQRSLASLCDARRRWLAPGGVMLPAVDTLWVAIVHAPEEHGRILHPWVTDSYGLDLSVASHLLTNTWSKARLKPESLLTEPRCWVRLEYGAIEDVDVAGEIAWDITSCGLAHGLAVWFDSLLAEDVLISNSPHSPEMIYGCAFFPFTNPLDLHPGDHVRIRIRADQVDDEYVWTWETQVRESEGSVSEKFSLRQSTFLGGTVSAHRLNLMSADCKPAINADGEVELFILSRMSADRSNGDIAKELVARFPQRYSKWQDALTRVGETAVRFGR